MVYGPGNYRFGDFVRVGGIVNLVVLAAATTMVVALG
jgi:di/tricarboxylate transporter